MRKIVDQTPVDGGVVRRASDPHDGSGKPRWFVEASIVSYDEKASEVAYQALVMLMYLLRRVDGLEIPDSD